MVLHHRFQRKRSNGTGKTLGVGLDPGNHRQCHPILHETTVKADNTASLFLRFHVGRMSRVALLPQKLGRPEKQPRPHFPSDDIRPLVYQQR